MPPSISFKNKKAVDSTAPSAPAQPQQAAPTQAPAKPSFVKSAPAEEEIEVVVNDAPLAKVPQTSLGVPNNSGVGGFEGEFSARDMATPYLSIMQKQSKKFDEHMDWLGQWVYDKETPLGDEVRVLFVRVRKYYVEKTEFGGDEVPQRFDFMSEVRAAGLNPSQVQETADLDLLIEADANIEGVSDLSHIIDNDKGYILARYTVRSTAYGKTVGILAKDLTGFLQGNLINGFYKLSTLKRQNNETSWYVPVLKTDGRPSDSLKQQILERFSSTPGA